MIPHTFGLSLELVSLPQHHSTRLSEPGGPRWLRRLRRRWQSSWTSLCQALPEVSSPIFQKPFSTFLTLYMYFYPKNNVRSPEETVSFSDITVVIPVNTGLDFLSVHQKRRRINILPRITPHKCRVCCKERPKPAEPLIPSELPALPFPSRRWEQILFEWENILLVVVKLFC